MSWQRSYSIRGTLAKMAMPSLFFTALRTGFAAGLPVRLTDMCSIISPGVFRGIDVVEGEAAAFPVGYEKEKACAGLRMKCAGRKAERPVSQCGQPDKKP